jgi:hypothetical protein
MNTKASGPYDEEATAFLNVDLDIFSSSPLEPLVAAFGNKLETHYVGREGSRYSAHLERGFPKNADAGIKALAALVRRLPVPARRLWRNAQIKHFNIGIQGGIKPHFAEFPLSPATLSSVVKLGAHIVITVYAANPKAVGGHPHKRNNRAIIAKRRVKKNSEIELLDK